MDNEIIISGQNMELTESLKASVQSKMAKLFTHDDRIIRLRIELSYKPNKSHHNEFWAKGHIEIQGPDMIITVASDDMYKSIDELIVKLARKIRRRHRLERIKRKAC
ncbi:MAG: ribosome-associated translation inhibitor RaiA [Verrucomicrobiaceae bacterium]|nr:ribosome-associated translation inhibitor RaiA [Verrucomicrobiaceae bacterium]